MERRFIIILQCWDLSLAPINMTSLRQAWASTTLAGLHCGSVYVCLFACLLVWCSQTDVTYISQPIVGWGKKGIGQITITSVLWTQGQYYLVIYPKIKPQNNDIQLVAWVTNMAMGNQHLRHWCTAATAWERTSLRTSHRLDPTNHRRSVLHVQKVIQLVRSGLWD